MASKKQRQDAAKKREKRSRVALIACGVLFLAVAAYEVPSILAMMNKKPPPGTTYDPGPSSVPPGATASSSGLPDVTGASGSAASGSALVDTDIPPASAAGQLVTFEVFQTKNPFTPQVNPAQATPGAASGGTPAQKPGAGVPAATTPATTTTTTTPAGMPSFPARPGQGVVPGTTTPATATTTTTTTAAPAPAVSIAVNGVVSKVATDGTFPSGAPVFRLVSYTKGSARIGVVGGTYQAGGDTITLEQGVPVTLQNTTDGKRYKVELLSTP